MYEGSRRRMSNLSSPRANGAVEGGTNSRSPSFASTPHSPAPQPLQTAAKHYHSIDYTTATLLHALPPLQTTLLPLPSLFARPPFPPSCTVPRRTARLHRLSALRRHPHHTIGLLRANLGRTTGRHIDLPPRLPSRHSSQLYALASTSSLRHSQRSTAKRIECRPRLRRD